MDVRRLLLKIQIISVLRVHLGKIIGVGLGFAAGLGLFGSVFGLLIGYFVDEIRLQLRLRHRIEQFSKDPDGVSLAEDEVRVAGCAVLSVAVIAAGSEQGEARYSLLVDELHEKLALSKRNLVIAETAVKGALRSGIDPDTVAVTLAGRIEEPARLSVLSLCMYFASRDHEPTRLQYEIVGRIGSQMGIDPKTVQTLWAGYRASDVGAYELLGVTVDADTEHIKRVYKRLAAQFHPDGGGALNETQLIQSEEAFKKILAAYRTVMRERGESP